MIEVQCYSGTVQIACAQRTGGCATQSVEVKQRRQDVRNSIVHGMQLALSRKNSLTHGALYRKGLDNPHYLQPSNMNLKTASNDNSTKHKLLKLPCSRHTASTATRQVVTNDSKMQISTDCA